MPNRNLGRRAHSTFAIRIVVCMVLSCQAVFCFVGAHAPLAGKVDLRAFYAAGTIVRTGHGAQLYDYDYEDSVQNAVVGPRVGALPFLYPSFAALPFVPLSLLSYRMAFYAWLFVSLALLTLAALILRPWLSHYSTDKWWVLPPLYACLFGVSIALMQGQISFVLLVIYSGTWVLLRQDRPFLAGLLLSVGLAKFQIAIPIFLLFCYWRKWRVAGGFLSGAAILLAVSLAIVGRSGGIAYVNAMTGMTKQTALNAAAAEAHYGVSAIYMPNLHGLMFGLSHGAMWGLVVNVILCIAVMVFAARQRASLLVALPAAMLVSYHMQPHDLTLLLLPLSFVVGERIISNKREEADKTFDRANSLMLTFSMALLIIPLAAMVMVLGVNFLVSLAVCGVMICAARMKAEGIDKSFVPQSDALSTNGSLEAALHA